jgi:hypothetical protein
MPKMVGKNDWNWGAKGGFFWAGIALLFIAWGYFRLPEPKGFTYAELDVMFEHKISARKFTREWSRVRKDLVCLIVGDQIHTNMYASNSKYISSNYPACLSSNTGDGWK